MDLKVLIYSLTSMCCIFWFTIFAIFDFENINFNEVTFLFIVTLLVNIIMCFIIYIII